jgi:hypothetical protein
LAAVCSDGTASASGRCCLLSAFLSSTSDTHALKHLRTHTRTHARTNTEHTMLGQTWVTKVAQISGSPSTGSKSPLLSPVVAPKSAPTVLHPPKMRKPQQANGESALVSAFTRQCLLMRRADFCVVCAATHEHTRAPSISQVQKALRVGGRQKTQNKAG